MDLIVDPPRDGSWNMAADELLLDEARGGRTALRLYRWSVPTWSLGRLQPWTGAVDPGFCRAHGVEIVRRPTGGRGVLHQEELTYAVAAPVRSGPFSGRAAAGRALIASCLARAVGSLGGAVAVSGAAVERRSATPHCFAGADEGELVTERGKLIGSAQRRLREAFLQHGSIPIRRDEGLAAGAAGAPIEAGLPTVESLCRRSVTWEELSGAIRASFAETLRETLRTVSWTEEERLEIERRRAQRYLRAEWT